MLEESDLQKLLRMKRHEQPPPEYFEQFLREFQRRQRAELLRRPLRQLIAERVSTFFQQFALPQYAYAAASAVVLVAAGITTANILNTPNSGLISANPPAHPVETSAPILNLNARDNFASLQLVPADLRETRVNNAGASPYYTLDARPVSYERDVRF